MTPQRLRAILSTMGDEDIVQAPWRHGDITVRPIGWYGVLGWARYREEALWRVETAASLNP